MTARGRAGSGGATLSLVVFDVARWDRKARASRFTVRVKGPLTKRQADAASWKPMTLTAVRRYRARRSRASASSRIRASATASAARRISCRARVTSGRRVVSRTSWMGSSTSVPSKRPRGCGRSFCADPGYVTGAGARRADTGGDSLMRKEPGPARCRSTADGGLGGLFIAERRPLRAVGPFARNTPRPRRWRLPPTGVDCSASSRGRAVPRSPSPPSRLLFAMGENDQLPAVFVATHPRFRTPMLAIVLTAAITLALALFSTFISALTRLPRNRRARSARSRGPARLGLIGTLTNCHHVRRIALPVVPGDVVESPGSNGTIDFSSKRWTVKNA